MSGDGIDELSSPVDEYKICLFEKHLLCKEESFDNDIGDDDDDDAVIEVVGLITKADEKPNMMRESMDN